MYGSRIEIDFERPGLGLAAGLRVGDGRYRCRVLSASARVLSYFFFFAGAAAALAEAPYFERACLRSATPRLSSTPRTMW